MEQVVFVHSVDCRVCVLELRDSPKRKLERLVQERRQCGKCKNCERLKQVEQHGRR